MQTSSDLTTVSTDWSVPVSVRHRSDQRRVLTASAICKSYSIGGETRIVLNSVDFHADSGECVFLAGPSGSGKSTLLSIMGCLLHCDSGQLTIADQSITNANEAQRTEVRRNWIGFVFQRFQLIAALNAEDNVALPLTMQGVPLGDARQQAAKLLDQVGLLQHRHQLPGSMSPGQCQRVALCRAVITQPKIILADEPTAALDATSGAEVMELIRQLGLQTGAAVVVVTHDPRIKRYADRICELANGKIL